MSKPGHTTRREAATKKVRALARKEQTTFREAICKTQYPDQAFERSFFVGAPGIQSCRKAKKRPSDQAGDFRPNGYSDLTTAPTDADIRRDINLERLYELERRLYSQDLPKRSHLPMVISLANVKTRIAKPKGIRKDYEWVDEVKPVIALDDDELDCVFQDDEAWEDVYAEDPTPKRPYAVAAASSKGGD